MMPPSPVVNGEKAVDDTHVQLKVHRSQRATLPRRLCDDSEDDLPLRTTPTTPRPALRKISVCVQPGSASLNPTAAAACCAEQDTSQTPQPSSPLDNFSFTSEGGRSPPVRSGLAPRTSSNTTSLDVVPGGESPGCLSGAFSRLYSVIAPSFVAFRDRIKHMTWKQLLWVIILVTLVMVGNFMQIVMLNFWLISFPSDGTPGNYTAFAVPGIFFAALFVMLFGAYVVMQRPSLRFATHLHGWAILVGVGFTDAFNSWMATYAASYTSEVLQALFTNMCPLYAVLLSKWILRDTRRYANVYIASVFVLTICGILAASMYGLIEDGNVSEGQWWILIYFLSMPVRVLMNVWQSLYMIVYTRDPKFVSWLRVRFAEEAAPVMATAESTDSEDGKGEAAVQKKSTSTVVVEGHQEGAIAHPPLSAASRLYVMSPVRHTGSRDEEEEEEDVSKGVQKTHKKAEYNTHAALGKSEEAGPLLVEVEVLERDDTALPHTASLHGSANNNAGGEGEEDEEEEDLYSPRAAAAPPLPTETIFTVRYNQGEDTIVKLVMLAGETTCQMCFTLALLPADALPWWGNSDTVAGTWDNFKEGINCVFTIRENFLYCSLYTLGFVFTYVGCAYLNHYSAALCSIVSQLSSPVTALMLVLVPSWNVQIEGDSPWYCNVVAIIFLCVAALVYVLWEEMTDHEKVQAEYELKMKQLHVRPSSHEAPHPVIMNE